MCVSVRVCVTESALYTLGNVRKFNNILIRLHFKGVAPKVFFRARLPRLKFHLNSYLMLQMLCGQWACSGGSAGGRQLQPDSVNSHCHICPL